MDIVSTLTWLLPALVGIGAAVWAGINHLRAKRYREAADSLLEILKGTTQVIERLKSSIPTKDALKEFGDEMAAKGLKEKLDTLLEEQGLNQE